MVRMIVRSDEFQSPSEVSDVLREEVRGATVGYLFQSPSEVSDVLSEGTRGDANSGEVSIPFRGF